MARFTVLVTYAPQMIGSLKNPPRIKITKMSNRAKNSQLMGAIS